MTVARSFGPAAEQMKDALDKYSKEELIDLLTHIVKTYVIEGTLPLKPEVGTRTDAEVERLASLTFPQQVLHLQMTLDQREWHAFSVSGEDVWVTQGNTRINLTQRPRAVPGSTPGPIVEEAAAPPAPAPAPPVQSQPSQPRNTDPPPVVPPNPNLPPAADDIDPFDMDVEASERFGMLEFD